MVEIERRAYSPPAVVRLGTLANRTESGNKPLSDVKPFQDGTAIGPPGPNGS